MLLDELKQHIKIQNETIKSLPPDAISSEPPYVTDWENFRKEFWGKDPTSLETIQRGNNPLIDDTLPKRPPTVPVLKVSGFPSFAFGLSGPKIVVRSEYNKVEQAALLSIESGHELFVVKGSPGIGTIPFSLLTAGDNISSGKSAFLLWLLVRRLERQLPTVLQVCGPDLILFCESGVYDLMQPGCLQHYVALAFPEDPTQKIWALFDSSWAVPRPANLLMRPTSPFFIVQTSSLHSQYHDWHINFRSCSFYTTPWSLSELIRRYVKWHIGVHKTYTLYSRQYIVPSLTKDQLQYFYNRFGASPRDLAGLIKDPEAYEARLLEEIDEIAPKDIRHIFNDPGSCSAFHLLATLHPSPGNHSTFIIAPASLYVLDLLLKKHLRFRIGDVEYLYDLLRGSTTGAAAAQLIFEHRMHVVLSEKQSLFLHPIRCTDSTTVKETLIYNIYDTTGQKFKLPDLKLRSLETGTNPQEDTYYIPKSPDFPSINSLLFFNPLDNSPPILFIFQMTQARTHDVKVEGLRSIDGLDFPKNVRKYYVMVTRDDAFPKVAVPIEYFPCGGKWERAVDSPDEAFPVLRYSVPRKVLFPQTESSIPMKRKFCPDDEL